MAVVTLKFKDQVTKLGQLVKRGGEEVGTEPNKCGVEMRKMPKLFDV